MPKILVVEDERNLNSMLCDYLLAIGYESLSAYDGLTALKMAASNSVDLILLDLMIPGMDGWDFLRKVRSSSNVPVIIVSARITESDKLIGFELGADDYVTKPYSLKEVAARIRAILRRGQNRDEKSGDLVYQDLILNLEKHSAKKGSEVLALTAAQFSILYHMIKNPGRAYSRLELLQTFQEQAYEGYERTIDVHIKNIRKMISDDSAHPKYIETVWGIGYRAKELS